MNENHHKNTIRCWCVKVLVHANVDVKVDVDVNLC